MNCNLTVAWIESRAFVNCLRHELCLTAHWLQFNSCERRIAWQFREQIMAKPIHDASAQFIHRKQTEQEYKDLFPFSLALSACLGVPRSEVWALGLTYLGFGLAHLRLTGQMQCSHLVTIFKFSSKNITPMQGAIFLQKLEEIATFEQKMACSLPKA